MSRIRITSLCFMFVVSVLTAGAIDATASTGRPLVNRPDPVVLEGRKLPKVKGADIARIRVFAYREGGWEAIPFQVDERFVKRGCSAPRYVIAPEADPDPTFDDDDELVFLARDMGTKAPAGDISVGSGLRPKAITAISAAGLGGERGYAYVMIFDSPPSPRAKRGGYMEWNSESRTVRSHRGYEVGYPESDSFFFNSLIIPGSNGGNGRDFVDTLKMRANGRIIAQLFVYDIDNSDWYNTLKGAKAGPVRVIRRVRLRFNSTAFRIHRSTVDVVYYPHFFFMEVPIPMGTYKASLYYQADLSLSLDLADDAPPMTFFNERNAPSAGVTTDGKMSETEKKLDYRPAKWQCLSGDAGTVLIRMDQRPGSPLNQDLFYLDDSTRADPPENYPGHRGETGFFIEHMEKARRADRVFRLTFSFPLSHSREELDVFHSMWNSPLDVDIAGVEEISSRIPPSLAPDRRKEPPRPSYMPPPISTRTRGYLPQILADPNLGYGSGFQIVERKTFGADLSSDLLFLISHRLFQVYRIEEIYKDLGPISEIKLNVRYLKHPNRFFYGIGNDRTPDDLAVYLEERVVAWLLLQRNITDWLKAGVRFEFMHAYIGHGEMFTQDEWSIEEKYGPSDRIIGEAYGPAVYGLEGGYSNSIELLLALDFRDDEKYPTRGTYNIFSMKHTPKWLGSDYEYTQYRVDLRFYYGGKLINPETRVPAKLLRRAIIGSQTKRVLAFRIVGQRTDAHLIEFAGRTIKDVPFYCLSYFGDVHSSRGHYWAQWKDNDVTYAMVEFRWHMLKIIDATLFYDVGRVWENVNSRSQWRSADWSDLHSSYGWGMRFQMVPDMVMRVDWGYSKENPGGLMYIAGQHTF